MALNKSTLKDTDRFLTSLQSKKKVKPSDLDSIYYILAKEFSLLLDKIDLLPIPYLVSLVDSHNYVKKEEEKEIKKSQRRK